MNDNRMLAVSLTLVALLCAGVAGVVVHVILWLM